MIMKISDILNNREIASIIVVLIFIIYAMTKASIRKSLVDVFKHLLNIKLFTAVPKIF